MDTKTTIKAKKDKNIKEITTDKNNIKIGLQAYCKDKKNNVFVTIKKANGFVIWIWVNAYKGDFHVDDNRYFLVPSGSYKNKNGIICYDFLEGICTPICHDMIEYEEQDITITKLDGTEETHHLRTIKGQKIDSKLADVLVSDKMAKKLIDTGETDKIIPLILILSVISVIVGVASSILSYLTYSGGI